MEEVMRRLEVFINKEDLWKKKKKQDANFDPVSTDSTGLQATTKRKSVRRRKQVAHVEHRGLFSKIINLKKSEKGGKRSLSKQTKKNQDKHIHSQQSISGSGIINRNNLILHSIQEKEALLLWDTAKKLGVSYDGNEDEIIQKMVELEMRDNLERKERGEKKERRNSSFVK
ncbi:hypothetical protein RIF29_38500 [Crotalaria pallida]|uniref:Uncharacterized protein n=1 Tax=Crotalaria pallida TaxID=3830 RepID=A0AAN9HLL0_CROPI